MKKAKATDSFEERKDGYGSFAYLMVMADAIRMMKKADPTSNIAPILQGMKEYVEGNVPDPNNFLEIRNLED